MPPPDGAMLIAPIAPVRQAEMINWIARADAGLIGTGPLPGSAGINAVIEGLDKIAFQTRVLAMNAAVGIELVVEGVHQLLNGLAQDYGSHAGALTEVSAAFATLNAFTQQNAAMVEESNAAARALSDEARALARLTERFALDDTPPLRRAA